MKIGIYMKYEKGPNRKYKGFIGDELYAESMCKFLRKIPGVSHAELYAPNYLPKQKLDFMIHLNDNFSNGGFADKSIFYMQSTGGNIKKILENAQKKGYSGYLFISKKILAMHKKNGFDGIFLPFGVDTSVFYPREKLKEFSYEVSYIGNDVKGGVISNKYLLPAADFDFCLYGSWIASRKQKLKRAFGLWRMPYYKKLFIRIGKGKIPQEKVPFLYSGSKINLNCTNQGGIDWDSTTLRPSEILACKGFLISDKMSSLEEIDGGIIFTTGGEDLKNKISYYLNHPEERKKIAEKGYSYIIKNNKMEKRMKELYSYLRGLE